MKDKIWGRFEKYKRKLENICNKLFIRWQKTFAEEKSKELTKKLNEIKECVEEIKKIKKFKNEKPVFKRIIISENEMEKFEGEKFKKEIEIRKNSLFDCLINYIPKPIKNCK